MATPEGPLSAIAAPVAEGVARWQATPEHKKNQIRAARGAFLLAFAAAMWPAVGGGDFFARLGNDPATWGWAGCIGLGLLWLVVGFRAPRTPRDVMSGLWWGAATGGVLWLLLGRIYPSDWSAKSVFLLHGAYLGALAFCAMRAWLALRGMGMGRQPKAPRPHPAPQGRAGDASAAEAYHAMRGGGGERISLDDREF